MQAEEIIVIGTEGGGQVIREREAAMHDRHTKDRWRRLLGLAGQAATPKATPE